MNSGLSPGDPTLVAAFRSALLHQGAIALLMLVFVWLLWATARTWRSATVPGKAAATAGGAVEARARWLLRTGFGVLWIFDGILQAQPKMAGGLATQVIEPIAASSPGWVQHLVNWGGTVWSYHPIQAGAASVWIQAGIGAWLIVAARGPWSRLAGAASVAWGLIVWVFGESFGGIFAPGLSWLTGAPGGVLFYVAAGALIALPEDAWRSPRSGRLLLAGLGVFFAAMAVLQAWPGRGFWQGSVGGKPGTLSGMVKEMAGTPRWTVSAAVTADGVRALGFGPGRSAWLLLDGGRAEAIAGAAGSAWRPLPPVPPGTRTLAPGTGGSYDALAVAGSRLTIWRLARGAWGAVQQIAVPVQYGSSG